MKSHLACAVRVRRHAQVPTVAQIGAHFKGVVALDEGPVVDDLSLVLPFGQRAVAAVDTQPTADERLVGRVVIAVIGRVDVNPGAPEVK